MKDHLKVKPADARYLELLLQHSGQWPAASIAPHDLNDALGHLAPSSHNRYRAAINNVFKFGAKMFWLPDNPLRVAPKKITKKALRWFSEDEVEAIFAELPP